MKKNSLDLKILAHRIIEFYEKISSWEHSVVRGTGLSTAQMHAIEIIGHEKSLRMKELAEKMGVTTGTLTVMVDRLEQNGFMARNPHNKDRRSILVSLTEKGLQHFARHQEFHVNLTQDLISSLTAEEMSTFAKTLEKIVNQI